MRNSITILAVFAASVAFAAPEDIRLEDWDVDGDGLLSRDEASAIQYDAFDTYDLDEDGDLKGRELVEFEANLAFRQSENPAVTAMGSPDVNGDELISAGEFRLWTGRMFDRLDTSGDGALSAEEMLAGRP